MILVIDSGNSRMKWGLYGPRGWLGQGVVSNAELATLALRDWQNLPRPSRAVGVNVAGEAARVRVEGQLARWRLPIEWLTATAEAAGVINQNELFPSSCVVVNAGTAVTIDALDSDGVFHGGIILPGLRLMLQSLADRASALKVPPGEFHDFPTNTPDALYSGVMQAICGAIEQMRAKLAGKHRASALLDELFINPYVTVLRAAELLKVSDTTADKTIRILIDVGVLFERTTNRTPSQ